jgi:hypothetical protein
MQMALERQKMLDDAAYKSGMLKYYAGQLKLQAKQVDDEAEKIKLTKSANEYDFIAKVFADAQKNADPQGYLMMALKMNPDLYARVLSNPELAESVKGMKPTGEATLDTAIANRINPQQVSGNTPNQSSANIVGGNVPTSNDNFLMPQIVRGGVTIENPVDMARSEAIKTTARLNAQKEIEMKPIRASVGNYLRTFDNAIGEMGGLETNALSALVKGRLAEASSQLGDKPNIFTLSKLIEPVSLQLGSWLNKGRPTDKDQAAAKSTLTRITYTKGANEILRNYLERIIETGDEALGWKVWNALRTGNTTMFDAEPSTSRFTIREKK